MANPTAVSDLAGEWFELYNISNHRVDLDGLTIADDGSNRHTIADPTFGINPGAYAVLAKNGGSNTNGGLAVDYVYDNFTLGNNSDEIVLRDGSDELLRLAYTAVASSELPVSVLNSPYGTATLMPRTIN